MSEKVQETTAGAFGVFQRSDASKDYAHVVFTLSAGAIVTPALLGSPRSQTMGTLIYQLMTATLNWPFGSSAAFILLAFEALPTIVLLTLIQGRPIRLEALR